MLYLFRITIHTSKIHIDKISTKLYGLSVSNSKISIDKIFTKLEIRIKRKQREGGTPT